MSLELSRLLLIGRVEAEQDTWTERIRFFCSHHAGDKRHHESIIVLLWLSVAAVNWRQTIVVGGQIVLEGILGKTALLMRDQSYEGYRVVDFVNIGQRVGLHSCFRVLDLSCSAS